MQTPVKFVKTPTTPDTVSYSDMLSPPPTDGYWYSNTPVSPPLTVPWPAKPAVHVLPTTGKGSDVTRKTKRCRPSSPSAANLSPKTLIFKKPKKY